MAKLIIGLSGQAGCGKGTVADHLRERYGAKYIRFSAFLGETLDLLALPRSRENLIKLSEALRKTFGEDALSYAVQQHAIHSTETVVVIDGIRRPEDILPLEALPQFQLIAIEADPKTRFERMKQRGEKPGETQMTWEQFLAEENAPTEITIPLVMERAQIHLKNNGTREDLIAKIDALMESVGMKAHKHIVSVSHDIAG